MRFRKQRVLLGTYVFILLNVTTLCMCMVIVVLGRHLKRQYVATGSEVPADCKKVCAGTNGNRTCVPLNLAAMVYENDVPLTSLNFEQNHFPAGGYIGKEHSVRRSECSLERHFPGRSLLPKQGRCAVVGNGGVLRGSGCGSDIDAHDFVVRCNLAPIEGYESDVGRKANLWGINMATLERVSSVIWSHWNSERKKDYDLFIKHIQNPDGTIIWYPKGMSKNHDTQFLQIIKTARKYSEKVRFAYNWSPIHIERDWGTIGYATTGLNVVALAQTFCSHISLYGFYPFHYDSRGRKVSYHYYDDVVYEYSNENHDFPVEYRKLQSLAKEGKIDLFTETCERT